MLRSTLIVLLALVAIQVVAGSVVENEGQILADENPHSLHVGKRVDNDRLLAEVEVKAERHLLRWRSDDYKYPDSDISAYDITLVDVENLQNDSDGGYPTLRSGGPGSDHVSLHFDSRWNKGFDFQVRIYGRKK